MGIEREMEGSMNLLSTTELLLIRCTLNREISSSDDFNNSTGRIKVKSEVNCRYFSLDPQINTENVLILRLRNAIRGKKYYSQDISPSVVRDTIDLHRSHPIDWQRLPSSTNERTAHLR